MSRSARENHGAVTVRRGFACALVVALAVALVGCSSSPRRDVRVFERSPDHPSRLGGARLASVASARESLESGRPAEALALLEPIVADPAAPFALRRMHQDALLALAGDDTKDLCAQARELAEAQPTADHLLLWARIAPNADAARAAVEHALTLDPRNVWAHYAAAYLRARVGDWVLASEGVARALELDPGHRAARRLEAAILARGARSSEAIDALSVWLAAVRDDPRISSAERADAQLDLAHLLLLDGKHQRALELLKGVAPSESAVLTRWCLLAAAQQAAGLPREALAAAHNASQADARALLPLVQIAILHEFDLEQREQARAAWTRVLASTRGATDLASLIQGLRARIVLERFGPASTP